jgi:hypothetical protein
LVMSASKVGGGVPAGGVPVGGVPVGGVPVGGVSDLDRRLVGVLGRLTERDRMLCRLLDDHRVLTSAQVADVGFTGIRRAQTRLSELCAMGVLSRFRNRTGGNPSPFHWVLGPLGAALIAAEAQIDPEALGWRKNLVHDLAISQRLGHLEGLNGFFTSLMRTARTEPDCHLDQWWSERRCAREWGEVVRPDGYGVWIQERSTLPFLLEHDNATERLQRLSAKLDGYAKLDRASGHRTWVLFSFPSPRREREARSVLTHRSVVVATCARTDNSHADASKTADFKPAGPVWLPIGSNGPRLRLIELSGALDAMIAHASTIDGR